LWFVREKRFQGQLNESQGPHPILVEDLAGSPPNKTHRFSGVVDLVVA
jgi:hypothetical protein